MAESIEILAYITADEKRVLSGDPKEQQGLAVQIAQALRANVVQFGNGDSMILGGER
ncbi:capping complex subunit for YIEGIA [Caproiciproducens galactitolivorans]|uniref:Uncharacterized protein n=1 Tax=Caproiciproducens galactitolivorans TaxID=642589 RepID=A0ABT4BRN4_9FIRM|nr:hypothetical protein [Caproiciproducens galactitolivorans]MCY1713005.1 hypothetical protein [Caproiciproducens galactitolivorans]